MGRAPKDCTSCQLFELCEKNFKKTGITFCDTTIKPRRYYYESYLKSKKMNATIELKKENVTAAYSVADANTKKVLAALFGDVVNRPTPTLDDYKTIQEYEDACTALGEALINETELKKAGVPSHLIALMKLETISRALWGKNFQPTPDPEGKKTYWYPWFALYTKQELERMDEDYRGSLLSAHAHHGAIAGFGPLYTSLRSSNAYAILGFRLCQETDEKATYLGRKFIKLWAEYHMFNFKIVEDK